MEAVVLVRLVKGRFESIHVDIPNEVLVLDYPDGLEAEPKVVLYKREGGVWEDDIELIEETYARHKPKPSD